MMKHFALLAALAASTWAALCGSSARATELLVEDKAPNLGIGVYDGGDIRWRGKAIVHPDKVSDRERVWSGRDVFESEYGQPLDFSTDLIAQQGYSSGATYSLSNGELSVTTGAQGFAFGFGGVPGDKTRPAIFPAAAWGPNRKDNIRLQMVLEQDAPQTKWRISTATPDSFKMLKEFTISGAGRQSFESDVAFARSVNDVWSQDTGLKIECLSPNVALKLDLIKLAPSSASIYWRKSFELSEKPILAHASLNDFDTFDLFVNGRLAARGNHLYPSGTLRRVNLAPFLRVGSNTIAYSKQFYTWSGDDNQPLLFEGVSVGRSGSVTRILSDQSWKASYSAASGWMRPGFDDSGWKQARDLGSSGGPHLTSLWDKSNTVVPSGLDPGHMGALDVAPDGHKYPLFEDNEAPAFRVRLPAGMQGKFKVSAEVFKAGTSTLVERTTAGAFRVGGDWTQAIVAFKTRAVGPYRVEWSLRDLLGRTLESRPEELIVIGPIAQQKVALGSFEGSFEKQLRRVTHIDCAQPATTGDEFLDHSGPYREAQINQGQVTTANGMTYRETGPGLFDYFSYRLHGLTRGQPYLVEVLAPDNKERAVYASVMESRPVNYFNNGWASGWHAATGAARMGGLYPITNATRKIRFLYYPSSASAAVTIINTMNGARAAASEINIYRIEGGLPALAMPESRRLIGPHDERMTLTASTYGGENPLENAIPTALNGHRDAWYHWYRIYERKIRFLRFQGFNMSIEGLYQYYDTSFPKARSSWTSDGSDIENEIDLPLLAIKMFKRNNIKVFLGVEYSFDPQLSFDPSETISDRRMWAGEQTFQAVDRFGRQVGRGIWGNGNFLHPTTHKYFRKLIQEIYSRYQSAGPVEGMYLGTFEWLLPGFQPGGSGDLNPIDIGYDDTTAALFEHETGIALNIGARDPQRFQKRYALLTGKYLPRWKIWRAQKVRDAYQEVSETVRAQKGKWKLLLEPTLQTEAQSPFRALDSSAQQRAQALSSLSSDIDMPLGLYSGLPSIAVASPLPAGSWQSHNAGENILGPHGLLSQAGTGQAIEKIKGMALGGPLDEINISDAAAPRWIWNQGTAGIFIPRPVEDNAMNDFVQVLKNGIPETIIYSWLDVNAETAFGPQLRRFNKSFAVTPMNASFKDVPAAQARGIVAQTASRVGGLYVRLINPSPYTLSGTMTTSASAVRDLVYDTALKLTSTDAGPGCSLQLKPNDIRILALDTSNSLKTSPLRFSFSFDAATTTQVLAQTRGLLGNANLSASIPEGKRAALQAAVARGDGFGAWSVLDSWEVLAVTSNAALFANGPGNQKRLLEMLRDEGMARIDVGASQDYLDKQGHLWLSDQAFLGTRFYGYARGNVGARGDIEIAGTSAPRVYQTELWGDGLTYRVPLPNGRYTLSLHFAETFAPFNQAGSRIFQVSVQGQPPESVDLVARAGGQYRPFVLSKTVTVTNGLIEVGFSGNAELNGVVIEKAGQK